VGPIFRNPHQIAAALRRVSIGYGPQTGSVLSREGLHDPDADPFARGFIAGLDERAEIGRLMRTLEPRSRRLLAMWFVEGRPVTAIADALGISRVHCYRLRDRAFRHMLDASAGEHLGAPRAS
jgi:DNA-directed RNA polymerase specialized sigma24 family protein